MTTVRSILNGNPMALLNSMDGLLVGYGLSSILSGGKI
jgi:hypothetical protein